MKLSDFGFMADENIHAVVIEHLRTLGWNVLAVSESTFIGAEDATILGHATAENRVVLTHDSDFGRLAIAALTPLIGIVYLRPGHVDPQFTIGTVDTVIAENRDVMPPFIIVAKRTGDRVNIRLRTL